MSGGERDREMFEAMLAAQDVPLIASDEDLSRFRAMMASPRPVRTLPPPLPLDDERGES